MLWIQCRKVPGDLGLMVGRNSYSQGGWGPGTAAQKSCGCPSSGDAQGRAGGGPGQPERMGGNQPMQGVGTGWSLRSLLWFHNSVMTQFCSHHAGCGDFQAGMACPRDGEICPFSPTQWFSTEFQTSCTHDKIKLTISKSKWADKK